MPKKILVVEDNDDIRIALCDRLLSMGFEVVTENNGHSALSHISRETSRSPIQGVLLDLAVPEFGGIAFLRELRDRHPEIQVIVMSSASDTAALFEARKLGARSSLRKPFDRQRDRQRDWERIYWMFHNE